MLKMNHKKAQVPEILTLVVTVVLFGYGLYGLYAFQSNPSNQVSLPREMSGVYESKDKFEIFAQDAAKLSVQESFSNISGIMGCPMNNESILNWDGCISNSRINDNFARNIDSRLRSSLNSDANYKITVGSVIGFEFESKTINFTGKGYNGTYTYATKFSVDNPIKEDFESVYKKILARKSVCIQENASLADCIPKTMLNDWAFSGCVNAGMLTCSIKTRQNYFHGLSFSPIEIKFSLKN